VAPEARHKVHDRGEETQGNFALVEHPIGPRALAAPMHTHRHEDEYTYVLEGEIGVQIGEEVRVARPGDLVFKPRGMPHAFWNAGDAPARALEIISPAGFERYFAELAPLFPRQPRPARRGSGGRCEGQVQARDGHELYSCTRRAPWPRDRRTVAFRLIAPVNRKGRDVEQPRPFYLPLFTNALEGVFSEVHIPDAGCKGAERSFRKDNLPDIAPASWHLATRLDGCIGT
jgi:quercetin dioxygenase-like cupin family protein